ncbi:MAG: MFS transporter [Kofleriaceae bacterium]|nr:MFS transporter [Kofleriaceae bacterium]
MSSFRELLSTHRDFRRLFLASVVSLAGDWFSFVAVADLVARLTGRPGAAAFVYAAIVLPVFLASPLAGAVADRYDRKRILVIADLVRVPLALLLCVAALWGSVVLALGAMIALGVAASFHDPVASAATPNLVPPEQLVRAQALMGAVWGSMLMVGAGIGGVVAEVLGAQAAFIIDAASFATSAWLIAGIERPMQERTGAAPQGEGDLREAWGYIRRDRAVRRLVLAKGGVSWANGIVGLLPTFAQSKYAGTNIATGLLFAARGLGAMVGPMLARALAGKQPTQRAIVLVCGISTLLYVATYALLPLVSAFAIAMALVAIAHLGGGAQWSMSTYGLQIATPDALRGRVLSFDYGLATLAIGTSSIVAGLLADAFGADVATWALVAVGAVYGITWLAWSWK